MGSSHCDNVTVAPPFQEYFKVIDTTTLILTIIGCVCGAITVFLWICHRYFIMRYVSRDTRKDHAFWLIGVFPFAGLSSAICSCIPRSMQAVNVFILLYFAMSMFSFWAYIRDLFNGKRRMSHTLMSQNIHINPRSPPCGCCWCCIKANSVVSTVKNIDKVKLLATQVAFVRPLVLFLTVVKMTNARGEGDSPGFDTALAIINLASTMFSMYGLIMLTSMASVPLKEYRVSICFKIVQVILVTYSIQGAIFNILADNHVISCDHILPAKTRAEVYNHLLLTVEALILSLIATFTLGPKKNALFDKHPTHAGSTKHRDDEIVESFQLIDANVA